MDHPKMAYTYVGIDSHKDTHTAVFLDCFFEKLGTVSFPNRPSAFGRFLTGALKLRAEGTTLLFGLEDVSVYGRSLTAFLGRNGQEVKHVNAYLVSAERKSQSITQKNDAIDAECAARVLLSRFSLLPCAGEEEKYRALRTLVIRHDFIIKNNGSLKNNLHDLLTQHYPNYRSFFSHIDGRASLAFFMRYPSPMTLKNTTPEELAAVLKVPSRGKIGEARAKEILNSLEDTASPLQEIHDAMVKSTIRQIGYNFRELDEIKLTLAQTLDTLGTTLTTMRCLDTVSAAQILSCIGDIRRFPTPAKLARYAGVAPVTYASGSKDAQYANKKGNRELNSLFYNLALRLSMTVGSTNKVLNPFFHEYYHKKLSEGKTKRQALKCLQRRLVNVIWGMLTYNREYTNPPMYDKPKTRKVHKNMIQA